MFKIRVQIIKFQRQRFQRGESGRVASVASQISEEMKSTYQNMAQPELRQLSNQEAIVLGSAEREKDI